MILFLYLLSVVAAFGLGVIAARRPSNACDDAINSGEGRGSLGKCFPTKTDMTYDPLISQGDYWDAAKKPSKRKGKGKRKGK
jgi:hypothetical protein